MRKRGEHGLLALTAVFFLAFTLISVRFFSIAFEQSHVEAALQRSEMTIRVGQSQGTIYDRNMIPLVNRRDRYIAAAVPSAVDREKTAETAVDRDAFLEEYDKGEPFTFECVRTAEESAGLTVFRLPERYTEDMCAKHLIGYTSDNVGVAGLEYAYDSVLRDGEGENSVSYTVDGFGRVLIGDGKRVVRSTTSRTGVVTTIDSRIQRICEDAASGIEKGAVLVTDVRNGDILAMVSVPEYSVFSLGEAVNDPRCPMIDRNLYSYSVGSIFKLVTACEAMGKDLGGYMYDCGGLIDIKGVTFRCHRLDGHGLQDMTAAMTNSCNTYFISLSRLLSPADFRERAFELGFGRENYLCSGMTGSAGVLPKVSDLMLPAEMANFSFGQGKLTATPLQINALTCAIANGGELPMLRAIMGLTMDGKSVQDGKAPMLSRVIAPEIAVSLRDMMISAITDNPDSNARTHCTTVGAKTSTAQTGRTDEKGEELCHGWITGFFPADKPMYAVTVLAEDGGYGNQAAAPVFREIADAIVLMEKANS